MIKTRDLALEKFANELQNKTNLFLKQIKLYGFQDSAEARKTILQRISLEMTPFGFAAERLKKKNLYLYEFLNNIEKMCKIIPSLIKNGNNFAVVNQVKGQLELIEKELKGIRASI